MYEKTVDEVINYAQCKNPQESQRTTVNIPLSQEIALKDLQDRYRRSAFCVMRYVVQHGFTIFEHENKDILKQIKELRKTLRHSKNSIIPAYLFLLKVETGKDNSSGSVKKTLIGDRNIISAIQDCSNELNINFSSFIQVLIDYSLSTSRDKNLSEIQLRASKNKLEFQKKINDILDVLIRLENGENKDETEDNINIENLLEEDDEDEK
ncbi:MAG: hypothetical protein DRO40_13325 [Thermoprotei archaeon]|nr:MAG: hypothetical protein DRO40_13325 [Thermoprotei archaeon]